MLDELIRFYFEYEDYHDEKLFHEDAKEYFKILLEKGRLRAIYADGQLQGYYESWRISYEQLGRIVSGQPFNIKTEEIQTGNICFINSVTIHPDYRRSDVINRLSKECFKQNKDCDYFIGQKNGKYHRPYSVLTKKSLKEKKEEGVLNGIYKN